jgi:hypothetical protein
MICTPAQALAVRMFAAIGIALEWAKEKPTGESAQPPLIIEVVTGVPENSSPVHWRMPYPTRALTLLYSSIALRISAQQLTC